MHGEDTVSASRHLAACWRRHPVSSVYAPDRDGAGGVENTEHALRTHVERVVEAWPSFATGARKRNCSAKAQ